jgi:DNA-binding CsgD family transcriptional regulator
VAVCALAVHMPDELALLTSREQDCLKLLAYGMSTAKIAAKLKIAVSTVHTHFKRARDKLNLSSLEALISFAARHCDTFPHPLEPQVGDTTAAVGAAILRASPGSHELQQALERP